MRKKLIYVSMIMIVFGILGFKIHALAQEYPVKPITLVSGSPAGGIVELSARALGNELKKILGVEVLVICKPGAGGAVTMSYIISMPPDGYTLGAWGDGTYSRAPYFEKLDFNPMTETIPIIGYGLINDVLIARGDSPFKTFKDAINFAKENPGKLTFGHMGITTPHYMHVAGLAHQMELNISMVPFKGDAEIILAVLGGHIMTGFCSLPGSINQVRAGKLKYLAVLLEQAREKFPGVLTFREVGFKETLPPTLFLIYGSKGLPEPIVKKVEDAFSKAIESAEFKKFALDNEFYIRNIKGQALLEPPDRKLRDCWKFCQKTWIGKHQALVKTREGDL